MTDRPFISPVSEEERNAIKQSSAHALPDSPRDHGFRARQVKPAFWKPLVQGEKSLAGLVDRVIGDVNEAFGHIRTDSGVFHLINTRIKVGNIDPVANPGSYTVEPKSGDVALTTDFDLYHLTVEEIDGTPVITPEFIANIKGLDGKDGANGKDGNDGVSPTVTVVAVEGGYQISVVDANGRNSFLLPKGAKGDTGAPFAIAKTYASVAAMRAGFSADSVPEGGFVLIVTGSVEDADNAKLYVKGPTAYQYLCDLSGAPGIKGEQGVGVKSIAKTGTVGLVDTYTVTLTDGSTHAFTVTNGKDGKDGENGADGISPTLAVNDTGVGYRVTVTDKNGTKSFQLLHGKDGEDGDGGGADERRSTVLCDVELGVFMVGEGNYRPIVEMPLADTVLPSTKYLINGEEVKTDASGIGRLSVTLGDNYLGEVAISGKTVSVEIGGYGPDDSYWSEGHTRVTVIGPGAMTCVAQAVNFLGPTGSPNYGEEYKVVVPARSVIPGRPLYFVYGDTQFGVMTDENGELAETALALPSGDVTVWIKNGLLTVDCINHPHWGENAKLTVLAETLDVGDGKGGSSGGSSGGGRAAFSYRVEAYQTTSFYLPDVTKTYVITMEKVGTGNKLVMFFKNGYVCRSDAYGSDSDYGMYYFEGDYFYFGSSSYTMLITVEELDGYEEISCFIEGTPVLLRDPSTKALYEKPIEQVLPFEYAAFWNPEKGRIDATRVLAPPIAGDAEEFDRLYFDNGTELDVYGVQFFWNVDTDTLVDWSKMEQGTRVCTKDGDIVRFVRAEHIVPEAPVKHYTLLTYRGRYIAGGIVAGDKRDLIYPRLMAPERVRYWRMLSEKDQEGLVKAHREGCRRRNWKYSRELHDALDPLKRRRRELEGRICERKQYLADTDHRVIKFTEGVIDEAAFAPDRAARAEARSDINRDEVEIVAVDGQIEAETERVRAEIAATWKPKFAGRFVGKNKVILEDET